MSIASRNLWKGLAMLLCGGIVPLGFAPFGWYPLAIIALGVLAYTLFHSPPRRAFVYGWLFGLGQFGVGVSWVHISIHLYGNAGLPLSIAVMLLLVAFLAMYPAVMAWGMAKTRVDSPAVFFLLLFPAAWVLAEWVRSWLLTGFPWINLGYSQVDSPLLGFAPLFGVYGVSWVAALSAGLLAWSAGSASRSRLQAAAGFALIWLAGLGLNHLSWTDPLAKPLKATLVQGNIPQSLKWRPEQQDATLERYVAMTRQHLDSDLVVWPETAVPAFYDQVKTGFLLPLQQELQQHNVSLVTGIPVLDRTRWSYFNAIISLDHLEQFYYKVHLVPFGEYLPLRGLLAGVLSFLPVPEADFTSGGTEQPLLSAAGYPLGASICYEIAFGEQLIGALPQAAFLINVSNDAWFDDSLAPHQHLEMARMRARETERYLLRATNTGISAIIDAGGMVIAHSKQFETESISAEITPRAGATPYVRWGNWPVVVACLLAVFYAGRLHRNRP